MDTDGVELELLLLCEGGLYDDFFVDLRLVLLFFLDVDCFLDDALREENLDRVPLYTLECVKSYLYSTSMSSLFQLL